MAIQHVTDEYVIPRGRVYFEKSDENGEEDMGNCPTFSINIETEKAIHYKATTGLREKDKTTIVQINRAGTLTCDNVSMENLQRWFAADLVAMSQDNMAVSEAVYTVTPGKHYQLGRTDSNPAGHRNISSAVITNTAGTTTYVSGTDYEVDLVSGRLQILSGGAIVAGDIKVSYSKVAKTWSQIKTGAVAELEGALRIISDNASGENRDHYMPSVVLTPDGDMPIITSETDYISMTFTVDILTPVNGSAIYMDDQAVAS